MSINYSDMRRRDCLKLAAMSSTSAFALSGCLNLIGDDGDGEGDESSNSPTVSTTENTINVPTVTNPIDVSGLEADPCTALSSEQLQQFDLKSGERDSSEEMPICEYEYANVVGNQVIITVHSQTDSGLAAVYWQKDRLAYFEPTQIASYPAVYAGKYSDRDNGRCILHIGLTDELRVAVFAQLNGGTDFQRPCDVAEMTGTALVKHLTDGS